MSSRNNMINSSTSSEDDQENRYKTIIDEKKRKRMISNRESARRSRLKREKHIKDINDQMTYFTTRNNQMVQKIDEIAQSYTSIQSENKILRMQVEELKKRQELLQELLVSYQNSSYVCDAVGMGNYQDYLVKPWLQNTFEAQTTDGIYQF
ncbi:hypothetical protein CDL12_14521 [Handroanthus impetiginosus]|uniref:BZIP domain-containing protein n=1 Tax=Handroanthus impetiginosus TaxID=429701 RepID=A0A2G9H5S6_9LAMI|nr:hypothetical protein CDL12_14521 [Handroanthus impetiginosus]